MLNTRLDNNSSHLAPLFIERFGNQVRLLTITRHPIVVAASTYIKVNPVWWAEVPDFQDDPYGNKITPFDPNSIYSSFQSRWNSMNLFEKILYNVIERISYAVELPSKYPSIKSLNIKAENLFKDDKVISTITQLAGLPQVNIEKEKVPTNKVWQRQVEEHPLGKNWETSFAHPEVCGLMKKLDYPSDYNSIESMMRKYQLPGGVMPKLRHVLKYWQVRSAIIRLLRKLKIIPETRVDRGTEPGNFINYFWSIIRKK